MKPTGLKMYSEVLSWDAGRMYGGVRTEYRLTRSGHMTFL